MLHHATWLFYCCCFGLLVMPGCDHRDAEAEARGSLEAGKSALAPTVTAIESHRAQTGKYPARLDDLVTADFLRGLPPIPAVEGTRAVGPEYELADDGESCKLMFGYHFLNDSITMYANWHSGSGEWVIDGP